MLPSVGGDHATDGFVSILLIRTRLMCHVLNFGGIFFFCDRERAGRNERIMLCVRSGGRERGFGERIVSSICIRCPEILIACMQQLQERRMEL